MTVERIARVVHDVERGLYQEHLHPTSTHINEETRSWATNAGETVIDATVVYKALVAQKDPVALYEDHPCIIPPWTKSSVCYQNEHGNVVVMVTMATEEEVWPKQWDVPHDPDFDWSLVRWVATTLVWVGGKSGDGEAVPTRGPLVSFQYAISEDGEPLDLHWMDLIRRKGRTSGDDLPQQWDMALLVHLGTLTFMNARNIDIVEPKRHRSQQKRLARTGVRVHELRVFRTGKSSRSRGDGQPLTLAHHGVHGHFAHYGACCSHHEPRGLLFGKYTGRVWVHDHVRGSKDVGEISHEYTLEDE